MQSKTPSSQYFEALSAEIEEGARVRSRLQRLKDDSMRRLQLLQDEKSDTLARLEVSTFDELTISPSDSKNTTIDHIVDKHNGISMNESQSAAHCGTKTATKGIHSPCKTRHGNEETQSLPMDALATAASKELKTEFLRQKYSESWTQAKASPSDARNKNSSQSSKSPLRYTTKSTFHHSGTPPDVLFDDDIDHTFLNIVEPANSFCRDSYGLQKLSEKVPGQVNRTCRLHLKSPLQNHTEQFIDRPHNCSLERNRVSREILESNLYSSPITKSGDGSVDLENLPISALHCGSNASTNQDKNILFAGSSYESESIEVKKGSNRIPGGLQDYPESYHSKAIFSSHTPVFTPGGSLQRSMVHSDIQKSPTQSQKLIMGHNKKSRMPPSSECLTRSFTFGQGREPRQPHDLSISKFEGCISHDDGTLTHQDWHQQQRWQQRWRPRNSSWKTRGGSSLDSENYCGDDENLYGSTLALWHAENSELQELFDRVQFNHEALIKMGCIKRGN